MPVMMDYTTLPTMLGKADLKAGYLSKLENLWGHHSGRGKEEGFLEGRGSVARYSYGSCRLLCP
jgi:hypothetical protein